MKGSREMTTLRNPFVPVLFGVLSATNGHLAGQESPTSLANVKFAVIASPARFASYPTGAFSQPLSEGESLRANLQVNLANATAGGPCTSGVTVSFSGQPYGRFPFWQVEATVRHVEMDEIALAYSWRRRVAEGESPVAAREGSGEVVLTEGSRVLLDYVTVQDATADCFRNVALELSADMAEDPTFADRRIGYDVWLVRQRGDGSSTRRLQLMGRQGERIEFDYGALRSPRTHITVSGSVRGRVQADGTLELFLTAERHGGPPDNTWATVAHGQKRIVVTPGEILRLELPAPRPEDGISRSDPETFAALAADKLALVVTPTLIE
jgi:hypothetical protein